MNKSETQKRNLANDWDEQGNVPAMKETETWNLVSALGRVTALAADSGLTDEFWKKCKSPLAFLRETLGLTDFQIVLIGTLIESCEVMSDKDIGLFLNCQRLTLMQYANDIEDLLDKRWIAREMARDFDKTYEGYTVVNGVTQAISHNQVFVPEKLDGFDEQQFIDKLESHLSYALRDRHCNYGNVEKWMLQFAEANPHLPLCRTVLQYDDKHVQSLLLLTVFDHVQWADDEEEGLTFQNVNGFYPEDCLCNEIRRKLKNGTHILMQHGYIEHKCEDGMANVTKYVLTRRAKEELLKNTIPSRARCQEQSKADNSLKGHDSIKEKCLYYNADDQEEVNRLTTLLSQNRFPQVQQRLEEQGMRKGVACLFYGAPGTGKTETVKQIARITGRDIMQVDIAGMRDKYVGESEKNIKAVFTRYRELCKRSAVTPILFFNEADGIISKRTEHVEHSNDKMDNAMQNIILQELEDLDGILIATTNLTANLDSAFERRFLFKIEFHKPEVDVKAMIWKSMIQDISDEDAYALASKYDFSGGQIENIARKGTINYVISGCHPTFTELDGYCQHEISITAPKKNGCHHIAGFA